MEEAFFVSGRSARPRKAITGRIMPENSPIAKDARSARRRCCCVLLAVLWCASPCRWPVCPGPCPWLWPMSGRRWGPWRACAPGGRQRAAGGGAIRLARVLLGLLCGGALAVAGVALQGVLRNPLADPFTLGISAGAACGASMAIALGGTLGIWAGGLAVGLSAAATVSLSALLGSLLALGGALWLGSGQGKFPARDRHPGRHRRGGLSGRRGGPGQGPQRRIRHQHRFLDHGQPAGPGLGQRPPLLATLLPGLLVVLPGWRKLDMLALGDEQAAHLGLAVGRTRFGCWPAPAA